MVSLQRFIPNYQVLFHRSSTDLGVRASCKITWNPYRKLGCKVLVLHESESDERGKIEIVILEDYN